MSPQIKTPFQGNAGKRLRFLLIALGLLLLFGQWFPIDGGQWGWPFFIIVPGVALFAPGLTSDTPASHPLIILGSITTAVGVLLFYQNVTDHWASWAYAWALVASTAIGIGEMIYNALQGHSEAVHAGSRIATIGLVIFCCPSNFP
jgi:hypothetical protein